jgi:hypothetical protein
VNGATCITESLSIEGFDSLWSCLCSSSWERLCTLRRAESLYAWPCAWRPCLR